MQQVMNYNIQHAIVYIQFYFIFFLFLLNNYFTPLEVFRIHTHIKFTVAVNIT